MKSSNIQFFLFFFILSFPFFCQAQSYRADIKKSQLAWTGHAAVGLYSPQGSIQLKSGQLAMQGQNLQSATFVIDMKSLEHSISRLKSHLKSKDFFDVKSHPTTTFTLTKARPEKGRQYQVTGQLTMLGQSQEISFPAEIKSEGNTVRIKAQVPVDRSQFGMNTYMSGVQAVGKQFELDLDLVLLKR